MPVKNLILFSIIIISSFGRIYSQSGCTDSLALNYDINASVNDGSCIYPKKNIELKLKGILPDELTETSGLILMQGDLWTINDSRHHPEIYQIDTITGSIIRKVYISNSTNIDWEAITADDKYLYIGDFGNNSTGLRDDLKIYKIDYSFISRKFTDTVEAEIISFKYEDQVLTGNEIPQRNSGRFDCEAFIAYGDSLHLFTKDWQNYQTRHYILPAAPGKHNAIFKSEFNVNGLITDAAISTSGILALCGYSSNLRRAFIWLFSDFKSKDFFSGNKRYSEAGSVINFFNRSKDAGQLEAICFTGPAHGFTSSEIINEKIAGLRIYSAPRFNQFDVNHYISRPEPLKIFTEKTPDSIKIRWNSSDAEKIKEAFLQRSQNNKVFTDIGKIENPGEDGFYSDNSSDKNYFYRIKIIKKEGGIIYLFPEEPQ